MRKLKKYKPTRFMAKTSHYDKDAADYAVMFIESLCHTKGTWAGKPFELIDWQEQIIRDLFGVLKPNGYRQFNTAYIEIPKKQGKSELAAAVALLLLCGDGEERAEVYGCAADRNQAKIVFDVAVDMVRFCPALSKRVKILESQKKITYLPTNSSYQVLSADVANKHGFNTHGVIFDELHTQPNRKLFDVMLQGSGDARMQPLYFLITTAGNDTNSICYEVHQKAIDIAEGRKVDPTFYSVIYGAAEDEDWTDPKVWKKANPSLGITVGIDKVKAACESAQQNPGEENAFRQLRLNQWVKQSVRWMPMDKWDACAFPVSEDDLEGRICYGGLDLSSTTDITAFVLVFPPLDEEDKYYILPYFWIPEETLDLRVRRDHVPYDLWERQGTLMTTEGNVVHYGYIEKFIERLGEHFNIREIAFDRWGAVQMVQNLESMGFTVVPFGQGFKDMSPPTKELMKLTLEQKLAHGGHPVLRWMMDNLYIRTDPAGNIRSKPKKYYNDQGDHSNPQILYLIQQLIQIHAKILHNFCRQISQTKTSTKYCSHYNSTIIHTKLQLNRYQQNQDQSYDQDSCLAGQHPFSLLHSHTMKMVCNCGNHKSCQKKQKTHTITQDIFFYGVGLSGRRKRHKKSHSAVCLIIGNRRN